jgi:hypothetical protein
MVRVRDLLLRLANVTREHESLFPERVTGMELPRTRSRGGRCGHGRGSAPRTPSQGASAPRPILPAHCVRRPFARTRPGGHPRSWRTDVPGPPQDQRAARQAATHVAEHAVGARHRQALRTRPRQHPYTARTGQRLRVRALRAAVAALPALTCSPPAAQPTSWHPGLGRGDHAKLCRQPACPPVDHRSRGELMIALGRCSSDGAEPRSADLAMDGGWGQSRGPLRCGSE